ncbi:MAG: SPASM domain-containing protein [Clostridia bacterium]|nr:SPASM domain-containing protein [Clostridia bacterium]MBR3714743.1 SPASM domain-containing protein [Clostridia bacterium]
MKYTRAYIEITNVCNKCCSFCHKTKRAPRLMNMEEFSLICDKLSGVTQYLYLHVMGEPLTHPLICDFISHAKDKGFKVAITTNGSLLERLGERIVEAGVYKVNLSLHSFEGGSAEDHRKYIESCLNFAKNASKRGVLTVLRLWNGGVEDTLNSETLALMHEKFPDEWKFSSRGARIWDKLHLEYGERFEWPDSNAENMGDDLFCYGLSDHFGILSNGQVIPCCLDSDGAINLGNIYTESIEDILSSPRACAIREGFSRKKAAEDLCKRCGYARRFKI